MQRFLRKYYQCIHDADKYLSEAKEIPFLPAKTSKTCQPYVLPYTKYPHAIIIYSSIFMAGYRETYGGTDVIFVKIFKVRWISDCY